MHVEPAAHGDGAALEPHRPARAGDLAVGVEPGAFEPGHEFAHPAPGGVAQARLRREGRVHLDEAVIDRPVIRVEAHLDHAEAAVDGVKQGAIAGLALGQNPSVVRKRVTSSWLAKK